MTTATDAPPCTAVATYICPGERTRTYPVLPGTEPDRSLTIDGRTYTLLMVRRDTPDRSLA